MDRRRAPRLALTGLVIAVLAAFFAVAPAGSDPGETQASANPEERRAISGCKVKAKLRFRSANAVGHGVAECRRKSRDRMKLKVRMKSPNDSTENAARTRRNADRIALRVVNGCHAGWLYYVRAVLVTGNLKVESDRTGVRAC
jgi:hypothetical protein